MAGEGDLAAIGEPIHHWMQIPEEFQLGPGIVLAARLLQGPLQCCHFGGEHQPFAFGGSEFFGIALVASL